MTTDLESDLPTCPPLNDQHRLIEESDPVEAGKLLLAAIGDTEKPIIVFINDVVIYLDTLDSPIQIPDNQVIIGRSHRCSTQSIVPFKVPGDVDWPEWRTPSITFRFKGSSFF